jgi:hypothetical protein
METFKKIALGTLKVVWAIIKGFFKAIWWICKNFKFKTTSM